MRLIPDEHAVSVHFLGAPGAEAYAVCVHTEPEPQKGRCERAGESPHRMADLAAGRDYWFAVYAEDARGKRGPLVEMPSARPAPPDRPIAVHAEMDPDHVEWLYDRSPFSNARVPARLWLGDADGPAAALEGVRGIRFRGNSKRRDPRKSFHVRLDDRPRVAGFPDFNFRGQGRRGGNRIVLDQTWSDPTGIRPALSFAMYEELGLPAPATFFADFWLNGAYEGHYVGLERVDREALRRWFLSRTRGEHTLVRDRSRHTNRVEGVSVFAVPPESLGESRDERLATLRAVFDFRGEAGEHDWEALLDLVEWSYGTPEGAEFLDGLERRFDVDALVDVLAIMRMQYDNDSFADDYWLYRDGGGDRAWRVIPWDKNLTFGQRYHGGPYVANDYFSYRGEITGHFSNRLLERAVATLGGRIDERVRELYEEVFTPAWFDARIGELADEARAAHLRPPEPAFELHPRQHDTEPTWFSWHVEAIREFVAFRRAHLLAERREDSEYAFEGHLALDEDGVAYVTGGEGTILARLEGAPSRLYDLRIEIEDRPGTDGLQKAWLIESRRPPADVTLTLPYENVPGATWLPEPEVAGRTFELTVVDRGIYHYPTRVNPFANTVTTEITLGGKHELEVRYRR